MGQTKNILKKEYVDMWNRVECVMGGI